MLPVHMMLRIDDTHYPPQSSGREDNLHLISQMGPDLFRQSFADVDPAQRSKFQTERSFGLTPVQPYRRRPRMSKIV